MHLQSPRNVLLGEHCSPESSHSNGSWRVTGACGRPRFLWSTKSYNQKSHEEQAACIRDKQEFLKYFILLGMLGTRSPSDTVQTALRVSFLSLDFFPFAAVLDPQCKTHLGQTESSQPLSSSLCRARKNTGVLSVCCDREQLGKIWGSDRGFGSTFRKQKAERQRGVEFQTLPAGTGAHSRLFLTSFCPPKGFCSHLSQIPWSDAVIFLHGWCSSGVHLLLELEELGQDVQRQLVCGQKETKNIKKQL